MTTALFLRSRKVGRCDDENGEDEYDDGNWNGDSNENDEFFFLYILKIFFK